MFGSLTEPRGLQRTAPTSSFSLDEPVHVTLMRDGKRIMDKLLHVLVPRKQDPQTLRDWDLWGPLVFCLTLALLLNDAAVQVFVIVWCGGAVITANSVLLGGKISFFQSICVIGYCVFPILVAAIFLSLSRILGSYALTVVLKLLLVGLALVWSVIASMGFLTGFVPEDRRLLAAYPVCLFYIVLAWLVIVEV